MLSNGGINSDLYKYIDTYIHAYMHTVSVEYLRGESFVVFQFWLRS